MLKLIYRATAGKKLRGMIIAFVQHQLAEVEAENAECLQRLTDLVIECNYSASSGLPFNYPNNEGKWNQLHKAMEFLKSSTPANYVSKEQIRPTIELLKFISDGLHKHSSDYKTVDEELTRLEQLLNAS